MIPFVRQGGFMDYHQLRAWFHVYHEGWISRETLIFWIREWQLQGSQL
jgi:hypothetical protein